MLIHTRFPMSQFCIAIFAGVSMGLCTIALAGNSSQEVATAATHAGFAAQAGSIEQVHMHLHHTVNCLVGPKGQGFDSSEANPCQKLGDGAIPDTTDAAAKARLNKALAEAESGLKTNDLAAAKKAAMGAQSELKQ